MRYLIPYVLKDPAARMLQFGEIVMTFDDPVTTLGDVNRIRASIADTVGKNIPYDHITLLNIIRMPI